MSVCVKKSIYVEEEKIRLTVLFRSAADKSSAPLSPILFHQRSSVLSVCVKMSICVEEEKIRLTVLFRSAANKCSAPLSPILFNSRSSVLSVCEKVDLCLLCRRRENQFDCFILFWTFEMSQMRRQLKCPFSLDKKQQTDFDGTENYWTNANKAATVALYTCFSSSLKRRMCKYFSSMSKIDVFQLLFYKIFHRKVFKKEKFEHGDTKMTKSERKISVSKWIFQLLKRNDLLAKSGICSLWNRINSFLRIFSSIDSSHCWDEIVEKWHRSFSHFNIDGREESLGGVWRKSIWFHQSGVIWPWNCCKLVERSFVSTWTNVFIIIDSLRWR